ncbi:MAG TPA: glycosyl hydrolase, partial [Blastocatellia bacterium]|nr:glycosyl hydrolase [Blastocatellia bacterium]
SAHQPLDTRPGNTMVGTHINRNITWAEQAGPFMTYLARNSFLLQQGRYVADLAYLLNEGAPSTMPFWGAGLRPPPPEGYSYDYVNADVLLNRMSVDGEGRIKLPDGMSYRLLVLPEIDRMTVPVLRKIHEMVEGGATVAGPKPLKSPGLVGYPNADLEVASLAGDLWGDLDGVSRTTRRYGKGTVVWGLSLAEVLASLRVPRDLEFSRALDSNLCWIHRRDGDTDIYYLANRSDRPQEIDVRFRVSGKEAELWHADTGAIEPTDYNIAEGRTVVPLRLEERESVFVVFRRAAASPSRTSSRKAGTTLATLNGPWEVRFPPNLGAPAMIQITNLESWTANGDEGVKYFSGTATYTKTINAPRSWFRPGARLIIDLGVVRDIAELSVNGNALGILWKAPYRVDATAALKPGTNRLEIKVTNEWTNRLTGDRSVPADKRVLPASGPPRAGPGPPQTLVESGLLGPVRVADIVMH